MIRQTIDRIALLATTLLVALSSPVAAAQWGDRTTLRFTEPVKVPGATLPAGSYVFELVNPTSSTHVVKISDKTTSKVYAITHAVPTRRSEPTEDVILLFTPMDTGSMPAIRGWFPQGATHGHLLLYGKEEARSLAERTKSVVLSRDIEDSHMEAGTIVVMRPGGATTAWTQDEVTQHEWKDWSQKYRDSVTPMVADTPRAQQADVADVEDHPEWYFARTVSVDGKVDEIYGPHLFELDEPDWGQPEGDVLVFVPEGSLAAVRENDRVTVTGTLTRFIRSDLLHDARWMDVDGVMDMNLDRTPVLVATRIVGGDNDRTIIMTDAGINTTPALGNSAPITDLALVSAADLALVGRPVNLPVATIHQIDRENGLFVKSGDSSLFVMVSHPDELTFRTGDSVLIRGVVLALPPTLVASLDMPAGANKTIYVYAHSVKAGR